MKPQNDAGGTFLTAPSPADPFGGYLVKNRVALGVLFFCDKDCVAGSPGSPGREPLPGLGPAQSEFSDGIVRCSLSLVKHVHFHEEKRGALLSVFSASVWLTHGQWPCRTRALAPQPPGRAPAAAAWSTSAACDHSGAQQGFGVKGGTRLCALFPAGLWGLHRMGSPKGRNRARVLWELHPLLLAVGTCAVEGRGREGCGLSVSAVDIFNSFFL